MNQILVGLTVPSANILRRVPAPAIKGLVASILARLLPHEREPLAQLVAVHLRSARIDLVVPGKLRRAVQDHLEPGEVLKRDGGRCLVSVPVELPLRGGRRTISSGIRDAASPDPALIAALRKAHAMLGRVLSVEPQPVSDRRNHVEPGELQATSDCHSANAAERRSRKVCRSMR